MKRRRGLSSLLSRQSCRLFLRGKVEMTLDPAGSTACATKASIND
jgi:hypothetical protein